MTERGVVEPKADTQPLWLLLRAVTAAHYILRKERNDAKDDYGQIMRVCALGAAAILALGLAGCTQGAPAESSGSGSSESGTVAEASAPAPAPFDEDGVKIAIVQQSGQM